MILALLWKATLVLLLALLTVRLARRARASVRHGILLAAFALLALLPIAGLLVPTIDLPVLPATLTPSGDGGVSADASAPALDGRNGAAAIVVPDVRVTVPDRAANVRTTPGRAARVLAAAAVAVWAGGAAVILASLVIAIARVQRVRRTALPCLAARVRLSRLALDARVDTPVDLVVHESLSAPITCGLLRPSIVLPVEARSWSEAELTRALVHELEHVSRRDWAAHIAARAICALYWCHPLVWMAYRQLCLEAEHACDDAVVAREESTMYADQLVNLARRIAAQPTVAMLGMAHRSDLSKRVAAVLDPGKARGRAGLPRVTAIAVAAGIVFGAFAPLQLVAQPAAPGRPRPLQANSLPEDRTRPAAGDDSRAAGVTFATPAVGVAGPPRSSRLERALVEAAEEGHITEVRSMLDAGVDANASVAGDGSPLIAAAREGHIEIVRLLLDRGADVNLPVSGDGNPLLMAAREGHLNVVRVLLDRGADLEFIVPGDENALINASAAGQLAVVRLLVERGANVNASVQAITMSGSGDTWRRTSELRTPLGMALRAGHHTVAEFLRASGATH